jgi:hypothetical protein
MELKKPYTKFLAGKAKGKTQLGRLRRREKDIRMEPKEIR